MCFAVTCNKCGKTTWKGCGKHVDSVMSKVPKEDQCVCARDGAVAAAVAAAAAAPDASSTKGESSTTRAAVSGGGGGQ